jgi:uncharacterized membrane protein YtjA (UPF0391 family)
MWNLALALLVITLVAAALGFGLVAGISFEAAKITFFVFLTLFVLTLVVGSRRRPVDYF